MFNPDKLPNTTRRLTAFLVILACGYGFAQTSPSTEPTYSVTIVVKKIRNRDGVIRFKFYDDATRFPHDYGFLKVVVPKNEMTGDSLVITVPGLKPQHMAIALLDDENDNVKLDFGWFLPKEGYAFSDYYHSALRRPVYEDFAFTLTGDKRVEMIMRYY
ncbi:MAG: DUF2141 domain-containing protein [Cyclobacteriaceae bacterium]|nr:DUF2141 domain-containing protein [Cyclobacteriaceae bacterium]